MVNWNDSFFIKIVLFIHFIVDIYVNRLRTEKCEFSLCIRLEYLIGLCGRSLGKVLVVGEGQSGRKVTMRHYLQELKTTEAETVVLPVTPAAASQDIKVCLYICKPIYV